MSQRIHSLPGKLIDSQTFQNWYNLSINYPIAIPASAAVPAMPTFCRTVDRIARYPILAQPYPKRINRARVISRETHRAGARGKNAKANTGVDLAKRFGNEHPERVGQRLRLTHWGGRIEGGF